MPPKETKRRQPSFLERMQPKLKRAIEGLIEHLPLMAALESERLAASAEYAPDGIVDLTLLQIPEFILPEIELLRDQVYVDSALDVEFWAIVVKITLYKQDPYTDALLEDRFSIVKRLIMYYCVSQLHLNFAEILESEPQTPSPTSLIETRYIKFNFTRDDM